MTHPTVLRPFSVDSTAAASRASVGHMMPKLDGIQVLELFMRSPRQVFSAERIMELVWGWDNEAEINVVWVNISNLRKKLRSIGSRVSLRANRGLGYLLEEDAV